MDTYKIALGDGLEEQRGALLGRTVLGLEREAFGRFRDAWTEIGDDGVLRIAIYTRNGGGNRPDYQAVTDLLRQHPCYLSDVDDKFDSTYATYYFRFPEEVPAHVVEQQDTKQEFWDLFYNHVKAQAYPQPVDTDQRWHDAIEKLNTEGPTEEQMKAFAPVAEALNDALNMPPDPDGAVPIIYMDGTTEYHKPEEGS